jgi:heptosyltransferase-1
MLQRPRILIVKLSAIGDVIHTLPSLNALRRHFPNAHITWLIEEAAADLIRGHEALDEVIVSKRKSWLRGLRGIDRRVYFRELTAFIKDLRLKKYDLLFDFQASLKGAVLIALIHSRHKIGFGRGLAHQELSYMVLTDHIPAVSMEIHALRRNLMLLEAIGIPSKAVEYRLPITQIHRDRANKLLTANGIPAGSSFLVLNPIAKWPTKLWEEHLFAELADQISACFHLPIIFTGSSEDGPPVEAITRRIKTSAADATGKTDLLTLAALLQSAKAMITTDTGPMHIAAAVQTPVVALFGPTAPWRTGPYGEAHQAVVANAPCSPCFKRKCLSKECMRHIRVDQIMCSLSKLLKKR